MDDSPEAVFAPPRAWPSSGLVKRLQATPCHRWSRRKGRAAPL